jgi:hypothetical protein
MKVNYMQNKHILKENRKWLLDTYQHVTKQEVYTIYYCMFSTSDPLQSV